MGDIFRHALIAIACLAASVALAMLWHPLGAATPATQKGYDLTEYLTGSISWTSGAIYFLLSFVLG